MIGSLSQTLVCPELEKFFGKAPCIQVEEVERAAENIFILPKSRGGILKLEKRWIKWVEVEGDYVGNKIIF